MRHALIVCSIAAVLAWCSRSREASDPVTVPPNSSAPSQAAPEAAASVAKIGTADLSSYAIPMYPGSTVNEEMSEVDMKQHRVKIHLESAEAVRDIAAWYRDHIKATKAQSSFDLGAVEGTTASGYPISLSIASLDQKSIIRITVDTNRKK